jgi:Domain of unknown function (DUF4037)
VPSFVPGVELSRAFYEEVVGPLLAREEHAAALLGTGSDVLGYDSVRSTDHGWGPRMQLFVDADRVAAVREAIDALLPDEFHGWPTRYGWDEVAVSHHVDVAPLGKWLEGRLGFDPRSGISTRHWLATPQQILLELTSGGVFHDPGGHLAAVRAALAWYPDDVWLWLLACQWRRLDQEEAFVGRTAEAGDELGSRVVASRLVRDCMRLGFLLERRYAPYCKWLGTAFAQLDSAAALQSLLLDVLSAESYERREDALAAVVEELARLHNASGVTRPAATTVRLYYTRPFRVLGSARFVDACLERVSDPWLKSLPLVGAIDQYVDSVDVLSDLRVFGRVGTLFAT